VTVLDRYLVRSLFIPLLAATGVFLTMAIVVDLFERLDTFIDHQVATRAVVEYYVATLPFLFIIVLPVATLIGVLFSLGGMARRNELIAMTASGVSLYRILRPVLAAGVLLSVLGLLFTIDLVPRGLDVSRQIYDHVIKGRPRVLGSVRRDVNYLGAGGRFFLIRQFDGDTGTMQDVVVQQFAKGTLVHRIDAVSATWKDGTWEFHDGFIRRFLEDGTVEAEPFDVRRFPEIHEQPSDFLRTVKKPDEMRLSELHEHVRRTGASGGDVLRLRVDQHVRYAFPFACFIVILLGAPLTGAIRRGGHALGFGLALLVGFVYYVLLEFGKTFGYNGSLPPMLAAWLPNLVFTGIGAVGLWKTRK
jgi:lipopolysaccharide export system permease protein